MIEAVADQQAGPFTGRFHEVGYATRRLATGVAVLTCGGPETVEGVTVSTFALASLNPPMVSVALREDSRGLRALMSAPHFVANGLSAQQAPLARHFASRDRASGIGQLPAGTWEGLSPQGVPLLHGAVAWLECRIARTVNIGDHRVIFAGVIRSAHRECTPLVGFAGDLHPWPSVIQHADSEREQ
jgi:flavin reductase (DIM6/NTAB) family NADH-FMN oxidoreductase RutF